jgi:hypothetical protein
MAIPPFRKNQRRERVGHPIVFCVIHKNQMLGRAAGRAFHGSGSSTSGAGPVAGSTVRALRG